METTLFAFLTFGTLAVSWLVGLACLFRPQPKPVRVKVRRHD